MGIFIKRPLCLFCFCFIASALFACATGIGASTKLALLLLAVLCATVFFALSIGKFKRKYGFIQTAIALVFVAGAFAQSLVFIDGRENRLKALVGEGVGIEFVVLDKEYSSKYSSKYEGKIIAIDGKKVKNNGERAYLVLEHEADFTAGDIVLLIGNISRAKQGSSSIIELPTDISLEVNSTIDKDLIVREDFQGFDLSVLCSQLRAYVKNIFFSRLDKNSAALSLGILTGDSSMIETRTVRDFRRAGLSHLLAVSGLHLTVLLGAVEFVLRTLFIGKGKRCVIITLLSVFLLLLSGFSPSACRALLMLLVVYLCYALSREPDTLTSLSVAGAIILLVSPLSVGSISFWLSFLATFGIIVYAEVLRTIRYSKALAKIKPPRFISPLVKKILGALIVTLSANVFICVVFWLFFGEASVISPVSNLLIPPLAEVYLILTVIVFLLGGLPFLGGILSYATGILSTLIVSLASFFSSLDFSVVSLKYQFAGIIICTATVLLAILFIVKLKKKFAILTVIVPIVSVLAFSVCLAVHNAVNTSVRVAYINQGERDAVVLADTGKCVIVDISDGNYSSLYNSYEWATENAFTEIEAVVLTHYHARHISSLDKLLRGAMVRNVCLPVPEDKDELNIMKDILFLAGENSVSVQTYNTEELFSVCDEFYMFALEDGVRRGSSKKIISFSVGTRAGLVSYADSSWYQSDTSEGIIHFVSLSKALILGHHGPTATKVSDMPDIKYPVLAAGDGILFDLFASDSLKICEFELDTE